MDKKAEHSVSSDNSEQAENKLLAPSGWGQQ